MSEINIKHQTNLETVQPETPTVLTQRDGLILRQHMNDADALACVEAVQEDPSHVDAHLNEVAKLYPDLKTARKTNLEARIRGDILMGIWDGEDFEGNVVGKAKDNNEVEVGIWLKASAVGHGYATLALEAMTEYLVPKFSRVYAEVHPDNQPSIELFERAGYHQTGVQSSEWGGQTVDALVFEPK